MVKAINVLFLSHPNIVTIRIFTKKIFFFSTNDETQFLKSNFNTCVLPNRI